eukprot:6191152-Pleurochrysis_carterae.AAC.1
MRSVVSRASSSGFSPTQSPDTAASTERSRPAAPAGTAGTAGATGMTVTAASAAVAGAAAAAGAAGGAAAGAEGTPSPSQAAAHAGRVNGQNVAAPMALMALDEQRVAKFESLLR